MNILILVQGGLGLPDRDYYFKTDPGTLRCSERLQKLCAKLFSLTEMIPPPRQRMPTYYSFEKQMASAHRTNVGVARPRKQLSQVALADLDKQNPHRWQMKTLLENMGIQTDSLNVGSAGFFSKLNELLKTTSIDSWKAYLRFHVLDNAADALSSDFENASFEYHGKALSGQQQLKPREERITEVTDGNLGEALGQL